MERALGQVYGVLPIAGFAIAATIALLALALWLQHRRRVAPSAEPWPYEAVPTLLTPPEQILFERLRRHCGWPEYIVLAQVQVSRVLRVRRGVPFHQWQNRVNRLSLDFVIVRARDTSIVAAIELDDASHDAPERRDADARKTRALAAAGIRLIRFHVRDLPGEQRLREMLADDRARDATGPDDNARKRDPS